MLSFDFLRQQFGLDAFFFSLEPWQLWAIFGCFVWGGFVRGAFSFGGAALSLPLLLLIYPEPLFFLPLIAVHLLFFGFFSVVKRLKDVDWRYLRTLVLVLMPSKIIGIVGLLQLPNQVLVVIIYGFSLFYAVHYLLLRNLQVKQKRLTKFGEMVMLVLGGYMSGTALSGAPLIVAVTGKYVARHSLRPTLFALWTLLVIIKLFAMQYAGISWQLVHHVWLLPAAAIGHAIGITAHRLLEKMPHSTYYRVLGGLLFVLGLSGLIHFFVNL